MKSLFESRPPTSSENLAGSVHTQRERCERCLRLEPFVRLAKDAASGQWEAGTFVTGSPRDRAGSAASWQEALTPATFATRRRRFVDKYGSADGQVVVTIREADHGDLWGYVETTARPKMVRPVWQLVLVGLTSAEELKFFVVLRSQDDGRWAGEVRLGLLRDVVQRLGGDFRAAVYQVGVIGLRQALDSDAADVRAVAAEALGRLGDRRALEPLVALLRRRSDETKVRLAATEALARIGDRRAIEALEQLLLDADEPVRHSTEKALSKLRGGARESGFWRAVVSSLGARIARAGWAVVEGRRLLERTAARGRVALLEGLQPSGAELVPIRLQAATGPPGKRQLPRLPVRVMDARGRPRPQVSAEVLTAPRIQRGAFRMDLRLIDPPAPPRQGWVAIHIDRDMRCVFVARVKGNDLAFRCTGVDHKNVRIALSSVDIAIVVSSPRRSVPSREPPRRSRPNARR